MNPHFFTAPFYFAFIWFRVQGSRFRALVAASPLFLEALILKVSAGLAVKVALTCRTTFC